MQFVRRRSLAELTAEVLREGLQAARWSGALPGETRLALELDVCRHTVRAALRQLETEGLVGGRGSGRSRVVKEHGKLRPRRLRVGVLLYDPLREQQSAHVQLLAQMDRQLEAAGNEVFQAPKSQTELKHDVRRIAKHLAANPADVWVVQAGSRQVLEWCAAQSLPCLALFGRIGGLPLASAVLDKTPALRTATRQLLALGHRRIVLIARRGRRQPTPGKVERAFLDELASHGIETGIYHLPDWEETPRGLSKLLERYYRHTPPTALIIQENNVFVAAAEFLARRRIHVPEQVSLVSTDNDPALDWCQPAIAQMRWDIAPLVSRIVRWVAAVPHGKPDHRQISVPVEFDSGGSIGPVWKG